MAQVMMTFFLGRELMVLKVLEDGLEESSEDGSEAKQVSLLKRETCGESLEGGRFFSQAQIFLVLRCPSVILSFCISALLHFSAFVLVYFFKAFNFLSKRSY